MGYPNGSSKIRLFLSVLLTTNLNSTLRSHIYPKCVLKRSCAFWHLRYPKYDSTHSVSLGTDISDGNLGFLIVRWVLLWYMTLFEEQLYLNVFIKMNRLVVDVVLHEVVSNAWEQCHFWQGEDIHELLHGVAVRALYGEIERAVLKEVIFTAVQRIFVLKSTRLWIAQCILGGHVNSLRWPTESCLISK